MASINVGGAAKRKRIKDQERAAFMKAHDIERTLGQCALCYKIVTIESRKSRFTHMCTGGR